jgi:hypothetical protein
VLIRHLRVREEVESGMKSSGVVSILIVFKAVILNELF